MDLYKVFVEQSPNAIAMFDKDLRYIMTSIRWLTDYHLTDMEIVGKTHYEVFPEIGDEWKNIHQECLHGAIHQSEESIFQRADGSIQWIAWEVRPWYTQEEEIGGILMYSADITKRKQLEMELGIQEEQFRMAFETSAIGMAIIALDGRWLKANDSICRILGYEKTRLYEMTFQDITHPDDLSADQALLDELLRGEKESYQLEKRYYNSRGAVVWALLSVLVVRDNEGKPLRLISQIIDITESKRIVHLRFADMDKKISSIAYELHENIAQTVASIRMILASATQHNWYKEAELKEIDYKLSGLITEIKTLADQIEPTTFVQENLYTLLKGLFVKYKASDHIEYEVTIDHYVKSLPFSSSFPLFRIVEDMMKLAVIKGASRIKLILRNSKGLILEFWDDGKTERNMPGGKTDLLINNIKTRVEMLGGVLNNPHAVYTMNTYYITLPVDQNI